MRKKSKYDCPPAIKLEGMCEFDRQRALEKQASRDADALAISEGRITPTEMNRINGWGATIMKYYKMVIPKEFLSVKENMKEKMQNEVKEAENLGRRVKTKDGFVLEIYNAGYFDWGLIISKDGNEVFYNPRALSYEAYGCNDFGKDEATLWTDEEWRECLTNEADSLIETFVEKDEE